MYYSVTHTLVNLSNTCDTYIAIVVTIGKFKYYSDTYIGKFKYYSVTHT